MIEGIRIRCPKCDWEPDGRPYWRCAVCYNVWNTFSTGGRCPGCGKIYKDTQCISCHKWSPHLDWYEGLNNILLQLKDEIEKSWSEPAKQ